jgi:hypothetical protein
MASAVLSGFRKCGTNSVLRWGQRTIIPRRQSEINARASLKLSECSVRISGDARIPTASPASIEANSSGLIMYVIVFDVGRRCALR